MTTRKDKMTHSNGQPRRIVGNGTVIDENGEKLFRHVGNRHVLSDSPGRYLETGTYLSGFTRLNRTTVFRYTRTGRWQVGTPDFTTREYRIQRASAENRAIEILDHLTTEIENYRQELGELISENAGNACCRCGENPSGDSLCSDCAEEFDQDLAKD